MLIQKQYNKLTLLEIYIEMKKKNDDIIMFFIIEEEKETILDFSLGTVKVLYLYFDLI